MPAISLPFASPSGPASHVAVPSISLSAHGSAPGTAAGSQPPSPSPRYRPYTVTHPGGTSLSPTPRSPGISILSSSPSRPALASSPQAVPASSSRQRATSAGPAVLPASPSALSRRPSSLRTSPRYLCSGRAGGVCRAGKQVNTVWKDCCVTLTAATWVSVGLLTRVSN